MSPKLPLHAPHSDFHAGESGRRRIFWVVLSAVIGVVAICIGHDAYEWAKSKAVRPPIREMSDRLTGQWVAPETMASLTVFPDCSPRWSLTVKDQGYRLTPEFEDEKLGIVMGSIFCSTGGHIIGSWRLGPDTQQPNRMVLTLDINGLEPTHLRLRRTE